MEKNIYSSTMDDFALVDNMLSASQTDIGESSNLAQIAQSYASTFQNETKYNDYVCILSVLAQISIDSSKRRFDIDITSEIKRIKADMDIKQHMYPEFWSLIKSGFNKKNINKEIHCPMNYLCNIKFDNYRNDTSTLPMSYFFQKFKLKDDKRNCKKVEELIQKYSLLLYSNRMDDCDESQYLLLRSDFEILLKDMSQINISSNYIGLMSWIIDRTFEITQFVKVNKKTLSSKLNKNRSLLFNVLYNINKKSLLKCLSKNIV